MGGKEKIVEKNACDCDDYFLDDEIKRLVDIGLSNTPYPVANIVWKSCYEGTAGEKINSELYLPATKIMKILQQTAKKCE